MSIVAKRDALAPIPVPQPLKEGSAGLMFLLDFRGQCSPFYELHKKDQHILPITIPCLPSREKHEWNLHCLVIFKMIIQVFGKFIFAGWRERCLKAQLLKTKRQRTLGSLVSLAKNPFPALEWTLLLCRLALAHRCRILVFSGGPYA